jgi:hypothetical protein
LLWFENKKGNDSELYFYPFRALLLSIQIMDMHKRINLEKMKQKQGELETEPESKR